LGAGEWERGRDGTGGAGNAVLLILHAHRGSGQGARRLHVFQAGSVAQLSCEQD